MSTLPTHIKVNGVRVNALGYRRKMHRLKRMEGTRTTIQRRHGPGPAKIHAATRVLIPPKGRQVYPRVAFETDCGTDARGMVERHGIVTCHRCRSAVR